MKKTFRSYAEFERRYLPKTWAKKQEKKRFEGLSLGERIAKKMLEAGKDG